MLVLRNTGGLDTVVAFPVLGHHIRLSTRVCAKEFGIRLIKLLFFPFSQKIVFQRP